jgi:hypothetical protein
MATDRQRKVAVAVLMAVLVLALYRAYSTGVLGPLAPTTGASAPPSNARGASARAATGGGAPATAPDVHLQALGEERPTPQSQARDLFRFGQRPVPAPAVPAPPAPIVNSAPPVNAGPPPPGPIPLRFIGIVESPTQAKRIAALVDPTGHSYQGGEGDIVAGQYRVLKIGVESIEMSYLDGRGRQMIRLSGS